MRPAALRAALNRYERRGNIMLADRIRARLREVEAYTRRHASHRPRLTHERGS
jgi:hypothetical protein